MQLHVQRQVEAGTKPVNFENGMPEHAFNRGAGHEVDRFILMACIALRTFSESSPSCSAFI